MSLRKIQNTWRIFRIYCGIMSVVYLAIFALGICLWLHPESLGVHGSVGKQQLTLGSWAFGLIGGIFFILSLYALTLGKKAWHWLAGAFYLTLSFSLFVTIPVGFWILYRWLQPDFKDHLEHP